MKYTIILLTIFSLFAVLRNSNIGNNRDNHKITYEYLYSTQDNS